MALIQTFRDLQVYQLVRTNTQKIFLITRSFPFEEKYILVNQIRRSSIFNPQSSILHPLSSILYLPSSILYPRFSSCVNVSNL